MNQEHLDTLIERQIDLMRLERGIRQDAWQQLLNLQQQISAQLQTADWDSTNHQQTTRLLARLNTLIDEHYTAIAADLAAAQTQTAEDESTWLAAWQTAAAGQTALTGLPDGRLPAKQAAAVKQALDNLLIGGLTANEALAAQAHRLKTRLKQTIRLAAVSLQTDPAQLAADTTDHIKRQARDLSALTQTWISSLTNQIHYTAGQANPLVKAWRHISILDSKTGSICLNRHGKTWDKQGKPLGHDLNFAKPPLHINCRSRLIYVFDLKQPFAETDGQDWVKRRSLTQLQEQFGKGIGQMLHEGTITLADAVKSGGLVPMTLQELRLKYAKPVRSADFAKRFDELYPQVLKAKKNGISLEELRKSAQDKVWQAGVLDKQAQIWIESATDMVWVSEDTLIKQIFKHADLNIEIYHRLPDLIGQAETVIQVGNNKLAFFKYDNEIYEAVIKTTGNREELYLVSVFKTSDAEVRRLRNKGRILRSK